MRKERDRMNQIMKKTLLSLFMLTIISSFLTVTHATQLVLTLTTQEYYNLGENITINGSLTLDGSPVEDGLVSIQINNPRGDDPDHLFIMRVLTTGSEPSSPWPVEILEAYTCDINGDPKSSFRRGGAAGFKITIRNNCANEQYVKATLSLFDSSGIPFATILMIDRTIDAYVTESSRRWIEEIIPAGASLGTAHLYASALSEWPQYGGTAWCPEKSSTFDIISDKGGGIGATADTAQKTTFSPLTTLGAFNVSFRISDTGGILGNYTIHAISRYNLEWTHENTMFEALLIADVDGDGIVDMLDLSLIIDKFMATSSDPGWDPNCDVNDDLIIDMADISIAIDDFLRWGIY
jgi:hypothetical protein